MKLQSKLLDLTPEDSLLLAVVHDIRGHLRASLTGAQMLQRSGTITLPPEAREQFAAVVAANKHLDLLLSRLSDYACASHLSSGKPLSLAGALQTAMLQFSSQPVTLDPIAGDVEGELLPREYVRIFVELIDNALKFSDGGPVYIQVMRESEPDLVSVRIDDKGAGIDASDIDAAFEPLTRLHSRDKFPGAGLGLPICKRIADAAGATIKLSSSSGGGTVATLTFGTNRSRG